MAEALPDFTPLLELRRFITIAHHVPGRIRLKLDFKALAHLPKLDPTPFTHLIDRVRGVKATRINAAALTVVVEYDPKEIAPDIWQRLLCAPPGEVEVLLGAHIA